MDFLNHLFTAVKTGNTLPIGGAFTALAGFVGYFYALSDNMQSACKLDCPSPETAGLKWALGGLVVWLGYKGLRELIKPLP